MKIKAVEHQEFLKLIHALNITPEDIAVVTAKEIINDENKKISTSPKMKK